MISEGKPGVDDIFLLREGKEAPGWFVVELAPNHERVGLFGF